MFLPNIPNPSSSFLNIWIQYVKLKIPVLMSMSTNSIILVIYRWLLILLIFLHILGLYSCLYKHAWSFLIGCQKSWILPCWVIDIFIFLEIFLSFVLGYLIYLGAVWSFQIFLRFVRSTSRIKSRAQPFWVLSTSCIRKFFTYSVKNRKYSCPYMTWYFSL